jgi:hypothetical protein
LLCDPLGRPKNLTAAAKFPLKILFS